MRTGHLFAGAGGGILADLINGHRPVWAVEWDPYACAVLRARFPGLHVIEGDVRDVDFRSLAPVDAVCGGFPCQDISAAGNGVGITGERSGLYREVMRAVDHIRPSWVFMENSPRIRTKGRHVVIGDLVALGYSWRDGILGAADVGAPHKRDRWWCLARRNDMADADRVGPGGDGRVLVPAEGEEQGEGLQRQRSGDAPGYGRRVGADGPMADTSSIGFDGGTDKQGAGRQTSERGKEIYHPSDCNSSSGLADPSGDRPQDAIPGRSPGSATGDPLEASSGCDQCPGWWEVEPDVGRVVDGLAAGAHGNWTSRIKALGNGQVPLAAAVAWRLLGGPVI